MKFKLRHDLQATSEGMRGGLPRQETDWYRFTAPNWDAAKTEARRLFDKHRTHDPRAAQYTQGMVLMRDIALPEDRFVTPRRMRLVSFKPSLT